MEISNWAKLAERNLVMESALTKSHVKVAGIDEFELAISIGHALAIGLDELGRWAMYKNYTIGEATKEAQEGLESHRFFEMRPADRNCAVRIEKCGGNFDLVADIRNEFEDDPKLEGGQNLQAVFTETIEELEL